MSAETKELDFVEILADEVDHELTSDDPVVREVANRILTHSGVIKEKPKGDSHAHHGNIVAEEEIGLEDEVRAQFEISQLASVVTNRQLEDGIQSGSTYPS